MSKSPKVLAPDLAPVVSTMQDAFREVGALIMNHAGKGVFSDKSDGSPVTDTDVEAERIIFERVRSAHPDTVLLGEESGYDENDLPHEGAWLIDPIDGTQSFIKNIPTFTSMAVFIKDNIAHAAVIFNPSTQEMYSAIRGSGAFYNGVKIDLSDVPLPQVAYCKKAYIETLNGLLQSEDSSVVCQDHALGAGYGFAMVLSGRSAARFNLPGKGHIHDYAPGALLVVEAGGLVVPMSGGEYMASTKDFVACHPDFEDFVLRNFESIAEMVGTR